MAYQPAPIDNPWHPQWDPRYLPCLTRPDPRYYRYVPDLSCYFVVAHHQSPDWQPGEGHPSSIRWLRNAAPELVAADGRLATPADDVTRGQPASTAEASAIFGPPHPPREHRRANAPPCPPPGPPPARSGVDMPETRGRPLSGQGVKAPMDWTEPGGSREHWSENLVEDERKVTNYADQTHRTVHQKTLENSDDKVPTEQAGPHDNSWYDGLFRDLPRNAQPKSPAWGRGVTGQRSSGRESYWTPQPAPNPAPCQRAAQQSQSWDRQPQPWDQQPPYQNEDDRNGRPRDFSGSYDSDKQPHTATTAPSRKVSGSSGEQEHGSSGFWPETTEISAPDDAYVHRVKPDFLRKSHDLPLGHTDSAWGWPERSDSPPLPAAAVRAAEEKRPEAVPPTPASQGSELSLSYLADYYERLALQCRERTISSHEARAAAAAAVANKDRHRDEKFHSQPPTKSREDDQHDQRDRGRTCDTRDGPVSEGDSKWNWVPLTPGPNQQETWESSFGDKPDRMSEFRPQTPPRRAGGWESSWGSPRAW
ncbi:hypothetical protein RB595_000106 [Gaeumannomyces hyphopodioides]